MPAHATDTQQEPTGSTAKTGSYLPWQQKTPKGLCRLQRVGREPGYHTPEPLHYTTTEVQSWKVLTAKRYDSWKCVQALLFFYYLTLNSPGPPDLIKDSSRHNRKEPPS